MEITNVDQKMSGWLCWHETIKIKYKLKFLENVKEFGGFSKTLNIMSLSLSLVFYFIRSQTQTDTHTHTHTHTHTLWFRLLEFTHHQRLGWGCYGLTRPTSPPVPLPPPSRVKGCCPTGMCRFSVLGAPAFFPPTAKWQSPRPHHSTPPPCQLHASLGPCCVTQVPDRGVSALRLVNSPSTPPPDGLRLGPLF